jgi:hypothetical protein
LGIERKNYTGYWYMSWPHRIILWLLVELELELEPGPALVPVLALVLVPVLGLEQVSPPVRRLLVPGLQQAELPSKQLLIC